MPLNSNRKTLALIKCFILSIFIQQKLKSGLTSHQFLSELWDVKQVMALGTDFLKYKKNVKYCLPCRVSRALNTILMTFHLKKSAIQLSWTSQFFVCLFQKAKRNPWKYFLRLTLVLKTRHTLCSISTVWILWKSKLELKNFQQAFSVTSLL